MTKFICATCGTEYPESSVAPEKCPICLDERQYVLQSGQHWTTMDELEHRGFKNAYFLRETNLFGIHTVPGFAIGQTAHLILRDEGNVLVDCVTYLDGATRQIVDGLGGIKFIVISHPHFYSTMISWADAFNATVFLHKFDREWVVRPSDRISYWDGDAHSLSEDVTIIRVGGHFPGSSAVLWRSATDGKGVLMTGDSVSVSADTNRVSFMYSFPNRLPLGEKELERIHQRLEPHSFDRIYGMDQGAVVKSKAKEVVNSSIERYLQLLRMD